jgi:hypothetical protein
MKVKGVEKKVFGEHKKHNGLSEIESKVAYVKTARSLSTYGVTFFLVKVGGHETLFHFFILLFSISKMAYHVVVVDLSLF